MAEPHPPPRRRTMPAGHVIIVVVVGLVVASFLNADSLKRTAETQLEQDSLRQDVALAFAKPLDAVSGFFRITWPRDRLDQALGKRQGAGFEEASPEDLPDPTVVSGPILDGPSTTLPPPEEITPGDPLRVWIGGDSLAGEYGIALSRRLNDTGRAETNRAGDVEVSSGLSRPDVFNWPAQAEAAGDLFGADVMVFVFGLNDDQAVELPGGGSAQFGTEEWIAEYRRRVGGMMDQQVGNDRTVVWVGIPPIRDSSNPRNERYDLINTIVEEEAALRPDVVYIDSWDIVTDEKGNYADVIGDGSGGSVRCRTPDGIHLETGCAGFVADETMKRLREHYAL